MIDLDLHPNSEYATLTVNATGTVHDLRDYGFLLADYTIPDPEAKRHEVKVPGRDGTLDFTEALGGVYFENRNIELELNGNAISSEHFHRNCSALRNALDGRVCKLTFSDDPNYYWLGRVGVGAERLGRHHMAITVSLDAYPYKLVIDGSYDPWRWDPFSFVDGVVTHPEDVVLSNETKTVTLPTDPARQKVTLWLNSGSSGSVRVRTSKEDPGAYHLLRLGRNRFPEVRMASDEEVVLYITGTGSVGVDYRRGSL
jgi:hypothetical protein